VKDYDVRKLLRTLDDVRAALLPQLAQWPEAVLR
jgi:hypothetical protein